MKSGLKSKREIIDKCHLDLWKTRKELESFGTLFQNLKDEFQGETLYGTGIAFERMARRLTKICERLDKIYED